MMRWVIAALLIPVSCLLESKPQINFHNNLAFNAHTFLISVALEENGLPAELKDEAIAQIAVKAYAEMTSTPRFHLIRSNTEIAHITSILMSSKPLTDKECPQLCETLSAFMPVYEETLWPSVQQQNLRWINEVNVLLAKYGDALESQLSAYFATPIIPTSHDIFIVDVIPQGASTSGRKPATIMSSGNSQYQNFNALEMVFHEIVHTYGTSKRSPLLLTINDVFSNEKDSVPKDFWHLIHFFTVGSTLTFLLEDHGIEYQSYGRSFGVFGGRWAKVFPAVEQHWLNYLHNDISMKAALIQIRESVAGN